MLIISLFNSCGCDFTYLNKYDIETLQLFNVKVDELNLTGFYSYALTWSDKHGGLMNMSIEIGKSFSVNRFVPDDNSLKAFLMTYKVLTEKNNHCSLKKISYIYAKLPDSLAEKIRFNTDFRQPFMFHQKIHSSCIKTYDQYCFFKKHVFKMFNSWNIKFLKYNYKPTY
jgi:hypothetical protein